MTPNPTRPRAPRPTDARSPRRTALRTALAGGAALATGLTLAATPTTATPRTNAPENTRARPATPTLALRELTRGNHRWSTRHQSHPHEATADRILAVSGQHPFALVLGCVDSRVPPELIFDQGLGDLMTVRSAGGVLDEAVLGSIAYGVLELDIPLVLVLGHATCGAVTAAVHADETREPLPAHITYIADQIRPAIDRTLTGPRRVAAAIDTNVRLVRARLAAEPDLAARVTTGRLAVVGARYDLHSQRVHRLPPHTLHAPAAHRRPPSRHA
ncbi:carbonic anhydrase [Streptomyces sp. MUM 203J]|uniref:carbonic anhydrase n=1 Tax=Streptomyces sp. MUM 203J TaxID=2791990 RepID=UPI001F03ABEA|nr:carbonic anhydrase [Streptomyces sp. MUM 203J]